MLGIDLQAKNRTNCCITRPQERPVSKGKARKERESIHHGNNYDFLAAVMQFRNACACR
jgi:hypothetical protein